MLRELNPIALTLALACLLDSLPASGGTWSGVQETFIDSGARDVALMDSGDYLVVGSIEQEPGNTKGLLMRLDSNGIETWAWRVEAPGLQNLTLTAVVDSPDNTFFAAGWAEAAGDRRAVVMRCLDANGYPTRLLAFGSPLTTWSFTDLLVDHDPEQPSVVLSGFGGSTSGTSPLDAWVVKLRAASMDVLWQATYGGPGHDYASSLVELCPSVNSGGPPRRYAFAGWSESPLSGAPNTAFLTLLDADTGEIAPGLDKKYLSPEDARFLGLHGHCDGLAVVGQVEQSKGYVARIAPDLSIGWQREVWHDPPSALHDVYPDERGLVVTGSDVASSTGLMMLFDAEGGDRWRHQHEVGSLLAAVRAPDGGTVAVGESPPMDSVDKWSPFTVRVDRQGELADGCPIGSDPMAVNPAGLVVVDNDFVRNVVSVVVTESGQLADPSGAFPNLCSINTELPLFNTHLDSDESDILRGLAHAADGRVVGAATRSSNQASWLFHVGEDGNPLGAGNHRELNFGRIEGIAPRSGGGYLVTGHALTVAGRGRPMIASISEDLDFEWAVWIDEINGRLWDVAETQDGAAVAVGRKNGDLWVVRIGDQGSGGWQAVVGARDRSDVAWDVEIGHDGRILVAGQVELPGRPPSPAMLQLDPFTGESLLDLVLVFEDLGEAYSGAAYSITRVGDCGFALAGRLSPETGPAFGWYKSFQAVPFAASDGFIKDPTGRVTSAIAIRRGPADSLAIVGNTCGTLACNYDARAWLLEVDANGTLEWVREYREGSEDIRVADLLVSAAGGYTIGGSRNDAPTLNDPRVIRVDGQGHADPACGVEQASDITLEPAAFHWKLWDQLTVVVSAVTAYPMAGTTTTSVDPGTVCP